MSSWDYGDNDPADPTNQDLEKINVKYIKQVHTLGTVDGQTYVIDPRRVA